MKTKSRLLLSAGMLFVLSATTLTTATYAWFTTTRTASVAFNSITAKASGSLAVSEVTALNTSGITGADSNGKFTFTHATELPDVSSEGTSFYKALMDIDADDANQTFADCVAVSSAKDDGYFVQFGLKFTYQAAKGETTHLYLGKDTTIAPVTTGKTNLANATRVALLNVTNGTTVGAVAAGYRNVTADNLYVNAAGLDTGATLKTATLDANKWLSSTITNHTTNPADGTIVAGYSPSLGTFTNGESGIKELTFAVRIWIEGTSESCKNAASVAEMATNINLDFYVVSTLA